MADTSPLVNLDLINKIYKTINAQINERVYSPQWNSEATLGSTDYKYKSAYVSGNISTGTLNNLTLTADKVGFAISGGTTTSKTLTIADTVTINKPLTVGANNTGAVAIKSGGTSGTTIIGPNNSTAQFNVKTTVGATSTNTGSVTIQSSGSNATVIQGPNNSSAKFLVTTTVGDSTNNGSVTVRSAGTSATTFIGPNGGTVTFVPPTGDTTATAGTITVTAGSNSTTFATMNYVNDQLGNVESLLAAI